MQARSNGTKRPAMLDNEADGSKTVSAASGWAGLARCTLRALLCGLWPRGAGLDLSVTQVSLSHLSLLNPASLGNR